MLLPPPAKPKANGHKMRWSRDDSLATVARITPDQGVEHATLSADIANSARLMHVEMRRVIENAVAHHAARFWIGLRCCHLKLRTVAAPQFCTTKWVWQRRSTRPRSVTRFQPRTGSACAPSSRPLR